MVGSSPTCSFRLPASGSSLAVADVDVRLLQIIRPAPLRKVIIDPCDQTAEHPPDTFNCLREPGVVRNGQDLQILRKKQIILNFVEGSQGVPEETPEVAVRPSSRSLSDVRTGPRWRRVGPALQSPTSPVPASARLLRTRPRLTCAPSATLPAFSSPASRPPAWTQRSCNG